MLLTLNTVTGCSILEGITNIKNYGKNSGYTKFLFFPYSSHTVTF